MRGPCNAQNAHDLQRAGVGTARAVFLFPDRMSASMLEADQQNVMRTWAVHHFSPLCPIYVLTMLPAALVRLRGRTLCRGVSVARDAD